MFDVAAVVTTLTWAFDELTRQSPPASDDGNADATPADTDAALGRLALLARESRVKFLAVARRLLRDLSVSDLLLTPDDALQTAFEVVIRRIHARAVGAGQTTADLERLVLLTLWSTVEHKRTSKNTAKRSMADPVALDGSLHLIDPRAAAPDQQAVVDDLLGVLARRSRFLRDVAACRMEAASNADAARELHVSLSKVKRALREMRSALAGVHEERKRSPRATEVIPLTARTPSSPQVPLDNAPAQHGSGRNEKKWRKP